ncbi:MAG: hypothetical protein FJY98_01630 [Candidatus Liptonbacteria bacterium]|nr:hypothetical protein [Candidatus Pacearchaeota archaeon]MBM3257009.1 hypothetical protein [Candidatus Liptonbacteria bacterium]
MKKRRSLLSRLKSWASEGLEYLKESRRYIYLSAALFILFIVIGFCFADKLTILDSVIKEMRESVSGLDGKDLTRAIFLSNIRAAFFSLFLGILMGIFTIFNIALNGTLIGYVINALWIDSGFTHLWKLLPHGIFELLALFIAWGLGIRLGAFIFSKNPGKDLKKRLIGSIKAFTFIIIPLLFIAAIIEGLLIAFIA